MAAASGARWDIDSGVFVFTVEALADGSTLHPVQQAMVDCHGSQCGFCTPGMVISSVDLCKNNPNASATEIRELLEGNLCRCTGYQNIFKAVRAAACTGSPNACAHGRFS